MCFHRRFRKEGLAPIVYLQSHCDVASDRDRYVYRLMRNISVDSYGACLNNKQFDDPDLMNTEKMSDAKLYDLLGTFVAVFFFSLRNLVVLSEVA